MRKCLIKTVFIDLSSAYVLLPKKEENREGKKTDYDVLYMWQKKSERESFWGENIYHYDNNLLFAHQWHMFYIVVSCFVLLLHGGCEAIIIISSIL